jgi:leader peptidase (prepilin peptidase)/N-methyltransferase
MRTLILIWLGVFGLAVGSFLNVVIYRLPRKMKLAVERSMCPNCTNQLKWYHNVPLLSYIFLRGKCAFCGARISLRYPLVELLCGLIFVYLYWQYGLTFQMAAYGVLAVMLLVIFFIDLDHQIIPDVISLPGLAVGLGFSLLPDGIGIMPAFIGLLVGGGSLYAIALLGDWLFRKESMGGGDIKMAAMLGAFLGWQKVLFVFIASAAIGLVVSLVMMLFSARLRETRLIPFGPFLALAAALAVIYGERIIGFYLTNIVGIH